MNRYVIVHHDNEPVALVAASEQATDTEALELAYRLTQNIEGSWSRGPTIPTASGGIFSNPDFDRRVTRLAPLPRGDNGQEWGLRSSMMGDIMVLDGKQYSVASFGFRLREPA